MLLHRIRGVIMGVTDIRPLPRCILPRRPQSFSFSVVAAKKGGGGGGKSGGGKKGPGSKMGPVKKLPYLQPDVIMDNLLMIESYRRHVGKPLMEDVDIAKVGQALWEAPFVVLAHDKFAAEEPRFTYANQAALDLWETSWDELVGLPSRQSAANEEEVQADRQKLLEEAGEKGVVHGYSAWRVSLKGRRFEIRDATLFNIESPSGKKVGQAVVFYTWAYEDGTLGGPGAPPEPSPAPAILYSPEDLAALEQAVAEQAALVRTLKGEKGLSNADEAVQEAVADLLDRKERLAAAQASLASSSAAAS